MRVKFLRKICSIALCLLLCVVVGAGAADAKSKRRVKKNKYSALVIEAKSGRILFSRYGNERRYPASLTKMMTLYLTFQALESGRLRLDSKLRISRKAARQPPSKLGLKVNETIRVYDAVMALVTQSANDAAVVLAEALGGSTKNFARLMTKQARALGMKRTVFKNPSGLPDRKQYSTASDMAKLGYAMIYHYPGFYPYFSRSSFSYKGRTYRNHNNLMKRYKGMDGIKTGYINASGFNLVASVERNGKRLIGVVFGGRKSKTRDKHMEKILNASFRKVSRRSPRGALKLRMPKKVAAVFKPRRIKEKKEPVMRHAKLKLAPVSSSFKKKSAGGWGIQVGAYSEVKAAQDTLTYVSKALSSQLDQTEQSLEKITLRDGNALYRARFAGLEQNTARHVCSYLVQRGHGCLVVTGP